MRTQRRIRGYRRRVFSTAVETQIENAVERECDRYGVSRSFVIANALAFTFDIKMEDYVSKSKIRRVK